MNIKEISSSITHIEDLNTSDFLQVVSNLKEYGATEKVDGSQLLFGIDEKGFYTSRETKGGDRVYSVEEYDIQFSTTYRRAAHKVLEGLLPKFREAGLKPGDQVEVEVLYGDLPNVVPYSKDSNYLIFLRTTEGNVNIGRLKQKLDGLSLSIPIRAPITEDGRNIQLLEKVEQWGISSVPAIPIDYSKVQSAVSDKLKRIQAYLLENTKFNIPVMTVEKTPLNKIPSWCSQADWKITKEELKIEKEKAQAKLLEMRLEIKEILLNHLVRPYGSMFSTDKDSWIEGVVLKHKETGSVVKIVDKHTFGVIREFAWKVRNNLTERPRGLNDTYSYLGEVYVGLATAIGHPELGTMQCKRYHKQMILENINVTDVKQYMISLLEQKRVHLESLLDKYEKEEHLLKLQVNEGEFDHTVLYKGTAIGKRTKETFASIFEQLRLLEQNIVRSETQEDLIQAIAGRYLS